MQRWMACFGSQSTVGRRPSELVDHHGDLLEEHFIRVMTDAGEACRPYHRFIRPLRLTLLI
jgi:hypothetical protein